MIIEIQYRFYNGLCWSIDSGNHYLLLCILPKEIFSLSLVANIDADGVALAHDVVSVDEVREVCCWVFLEKQQLVPFEPHVSFVG